MNTSALIQKVWNFCHTLKDDGVGYGDYLEQLTYLLFLKMAHEYTQPPYSRATQVPAGFDWAALRTKTGEPLEAQYLATLHRLGQEGGMLGAIFFKAQNKIQDPAKLARLVQMIDAESWVGMDADTKGDLYEGLLQKNAEDTKSGAGQYFTPRAVIRAMVACMRPEPGKTIADPACGTGGFFLGAYNWLTRPGQTLNKKQAAFLRQETFYGNEIVPGTRRLCLMNLFLHNVAMLGSRGKAAVVLPDNVLFEGGAGEKIRRKWLETCDVHTILRLPTGIFYAQGVKANVVFFDARPKDGTGQTRGVWFYDLRTNKHFTLKTRQLVYEDLEEFVACYRPENRHQRESGERWRFYGVDELMARDKASLDVFWLKDDSLDNLAGLPPPDVLQQEIIDHLEAALAAFRDVAAGLPKSTAGTP